MITATKWVPRGYAAQFPTKYEMDDDEMERISELAKLKLSDAQDDLAAAEEGSGADSEDEDEDEDKENAGVKVSAGVGSGSAPAEAMEEDSK